MLNLTADMISNFGDVLFYLALMNYVLLLPDPKYAIAIITLSETVPMLAPMFVGYFADKAKYKLEGIVGTLLFRAGIYTIVGILMGFTPALWIVVVVAIINFLSDIAGQYESGLFTPVSLKIVPDEDRQEYIAFRQTVSQSLNIGFRTSSAILVGIMSYQVLAFVNVGTFLLALAIMLAIFRPLKKILLEESAVAETSQELPLEEEKEKKPFLKDLREKILIAYTELKKIPEVFVTLLAAPFLNGIFVVIHPLLVLFISEDNNFVIVNSQTTIAGVAVVNSVMAIVGSFLSMNLLKNVSLLTFINLFALTALGIFGSFLINNVYGVILFLALAMLFATALQPKLSATVLNSLDKSSLATILGILGTYAQLGMIVMSIIFAWLAAIFSGKIIAVIFLILSAVLAIWILFFTNVKLGGERK